MKNFVFDLYGTLVDIRTDEANPKFRRRMVKYFNRADFWQQYFSICKSFETEDEYCEIDLSKVFIKLSPENPECAAKYFREKSRSRLKAYKGVHTLLKSLKAKDARLFLLSNAQSCFTNEELKKLKLTQYFEGIVLSSDFGKKKPSEDFFEHIIEKFSLDKSHTVYIGNDIHADILGAKAVGLSTAYIKSNLSPQSDSMDNARSVSDFATESFKVLSEYLLSL